jgi:hypothetical protein
MKNNFPKLSLLASAVIFLLLCFAFMFLNGKINANNDQARLEKETWQAEQNKRDATTLLDQSLQQVAPARALLDTHFAKTSDVVPFFNTMDEKLAPITGVKASIDSVETGTNNSQIIVNLKAAGSFESIYKFLTLLENSPYELDFISMDIHSLGGVTTTDPKVQNAGWEATFRIQLLSLVKDNP